MSRLARVLLFFAALLFGAAGAGLAPSAHAADAPNPIRGFSASLRATGAPPAVGAVLTFDAQAQFQGNDEQTDPWMVFIFNFGGSIKSVPKQEGDNGDTFRGSVTHTFDEPGTYAVKIGAYHGNDLFGYKYSRTKTIYVTVACAGYDPGPKKCEKAAFSPMTGTWLWDYDGFRGELTLTQAAGTKTASGNVTVKNENGDVLFASACAGPVEPTRYTTLAGPGDALRFKAKMRTPEGKKTLTFILFTHSHATDAYFTGNVLIEGTPYFSEGPVNVGTFLRETERQAVLCTTLAAGKKKVKPGSLLAVTCVVQNSGPMSVPAGAVDGFVDVEGGTIVENLIGPVRCAGVVPSDSELQLAFLAMGAGKTTTLARAGVGFAVLVDDDATEVRITFSVAAPYAPNITQVAVPPDRVICVAVEQPNPAAK